MNGHRTPNRYKLFTLNENLILTVLGQWRRGEYVALPEPNNLPPGWELHGVQWSPQHLGFTLAVYHPGFPEVEPGQHIPLADDASLVWGEHVFRVAEQNLWADHAEWSQKTFGSDDTRGPAGSLKHLAKEAAEAAEAPGDETELADCLLLVFDAARRSGLTFDRLMKAAREKLEVNKTRPWPAIVPNNDEPVEHVREET